MRRPSLLHLLATAATLSGSWYVLGRPLLRDRAQRGDYLFGHYSLEEIYVGFPLLALALAFTALWMVRRDRRAQLGRRLIAVTASSLAAVVAFDLTYALFLRGAWTAQYWLDSEHISRADNEPDPDFGFVRKPHARWSGRVPGTDREVEYRADARGFRNPDGIDSAQIAFVGDSYTEAAQVPLENSFAAMVGVRLQKSVVNLGRGAYGPQQEALVIERYALEFHPELVVWQLFDGNDLGDAEQFAAWKLGEGGAVPLRERYFGNSFFHPLLHATFDSKKGLFAKLRLDDGTELPITVRYRWMPHQTNTRKRGWIETERAIQSGVASCRKAGVKVLIVFIPVAARILRDRIDYGAPSDALAYAPDDAGGTDDFASALANTCRELSVDFLDLTEVFQAAAQSKADGIFIPRDEHLDLRGHELAASAIGAWLTAPR